MIHEKYDVDTATSFSIDIAEAPADGKKYPIVVLIHGNLGLKKPFGDALRKFTEKFASLNYLAALPSYYPDGASDKGDKAINSHLPALTAAVKHLSRRSDADPTRVGLVGFSLGGGIGMSYINSNVTGSVQLFADFYGNVAPLLSGGVAKFPSTITFSNNHDPVVPPAENSQLLIDALQKAHIDNDPHWYDDDWEGGYFHAFEPGGDADKKSRSLATSWFTKYMPPTGR